jgi:hypothetical protein
MSRSNQQPNFNPYPTITDRKALMPFGQHKGIDIDTILFRDPGYLVYMVDKGFLDLDHVLYDEALDNAGGKQRST